MPLFDKKEINDYQRERYLSYEIKTVENLLNRYDEILKTFSKKKAPIKILDIGGGGGHLCAALDKRYRDIEHESWNQFDTIHFIKDSAFHAENHFCPDSFDIVFVNYVFHHLVQNSYRHTIEGFNNILKQIKHLLKDDGVLLVSECYYCFPAFKNASSFLAYMASTVEIPLAANLLRKFGIKSAGVGVCFLSPDKWKRVFADNEFKMIWFHNGKEKSVKHILWEIFFEFCLCKQGYNELAIK